MKCFVTISLEMFTVMFYLNDPSKAAVKCARLSLQISITKPICEPIDVDVVIIRTTITF